MSKIQYFRNKISKSPSARPQHQHPLTSDFGDLKLRDLAKQWFSNYLWWNRN